MVIRKHAKIILSVLPFAILLGAILFLRPFPGLMDDATHLYDLVPRIEKDGLWDAILGQALTDLRLGMFRPVYTIMAYTLYKGVSLDSYFSHYIRNWVFCLLILFFFARQFSKLLKLPFWLTLVTPFAFYYFHDLFMFPSLQEKLLLFFGVILIYSVANQDNRYWLSAATVATILGVMTKTSFIIFFPASTVLLFRDALINKSMSHLRASQIFVFLMFLLSVLGLGYLARSGTYGAGRYGIEQLFINLASKEFFILSIPAIISAWLGRSEWRTGNISYFIPHLTLLGFYAVFLPWGMSSYLQVLIIPFVGLCVVQVLSAPCFSANTGKIFSLGLISLVLTVTTFRAVWSFTRLADLGAVLEVAKKIGSDDRVFANCDEGALAMSRYLSELSGGPRLVLRWPNDSVVGDFYLIGDRGLCPMPHDQPENCVSESIFSGRYGSSFSLLKISCASKGG